MKRLWIALALAIPVAANAASGNPDDYVRYLVPLIQHDLRGANGSVWTAELKFRNRAQSAVGVVGAFCGPAGPDPCFSPLNFPAGTTLDAQLFPRGDGADGAFVYVPKSASPRPAMTLHVRDTSQNATSFGTEIDLPLADEFQQQVDLIAISTDARYRGTLRIYGTTSAPQPVRIRTYDESGETLLSFQTLMLSGIVNIAADPMPFYPAYAQLDAIPDSVRAADSKRIRIMVDTMSESLVSPSPAPIWAFVTVTDNVTQLTSTITPSR